MFLSSLPSVSVELIQPSNFNTVCISIQMTRGTWPFVVKVKSRIIQALLDSFNMGFNVAGLSFLAAVQIFDPTSLPHRHKTAWAVGEDELQRRCEKYAEWVLRRGKLATKLSNCRMADDVWQRKNLKGVHPGSNFQASGCASTRPRSFASFQSMAMSNHFLTERVSGPFMEILTSELRVWFNHRFRKEVLIRFNVEKPALERMSTWEMVRTFLAKAQWLGKQE